MIFIIIVATSSVFASWMLVEKTGLRYLLGTISMVVFMTSIALLTDHFTHHTGMVVKTSETTKEIYSAAGSESPFGLLIQQEVGTDSDNYVLVYRDKEEDQEAKAHFVPKKDEPIESVKQRKGYLSRSRCRQSNCHHSDKTLCLEIRCCKALIWFW